MDSKKIVLFTLAVVAIGIFALPQSVALFSGQHNWYDLGPRGNDVPCEKCHDDIADEMESTGAHINIECDGCHRTDKRVEYARAGGAGQHEAYPGEGAHAASTQECMVCHDGGSNFMHDNLNCGSNPCHAPPSMSVPAAGGFDMTENSADTGEKAAHMKFVENAMDEPLMEGANEACIACHTRVGINITWTKNEILVFDASEDEVGNWTIPSFAAEGSNVTYVNSSNEWTE